MYSNIFYNEVGISIDSIYYLWHKGLVNGLHHFWSRDIYFWAELTASIVNDKEPLIGENDTIIFIKATISRLSLAMNLLSTFKSDTGFLPDPFSRT